MRESEAKASVVTIDRTANGSVTFGVKASAKSLRIAREKAEEAFDALGRFADQQTRLARQRERKIIDDEINAATRKP
jgi:hypothetical protein